MSTIAALSADSLGRLQELAAAVQSAQVKHRDAVAAVMTAQEVQRGTAALLASAEAAFRHACPVAFGLVPKNEGSNAVREWLRERCDLGNRMASTTTSDLYRDFTSWGAATQRLDCCPSQWSVTRFGRRLSDLGFYGRKDPRGNKLRVGITLIHGAAQ